MVQGYYQRIKKGYTMSEYDLLESEILCKCCQLPKLHCLVKLDGLLFKKDRQTLNLTQVQLAPLLGVSVKSIKNYEQGIRKPSKAVLMLLDGLMKAHSL